VEIQLKEVLLNLNDLLNMEALILQLTLNLQMEAGSHLKRLRRPSNHRKLNQMPLLQLPKRSK